MDYYEGYMLDDIYVWELSDSDKKLLDAVVYMIDHKCTIRCAAANCEYKRSTLHNHIYSRLSKLSYEMYKIVERQLRYNRLIK